APLRSAANTWAPIALSELRGRTASLGRRVPIWFAGCIANTHLETGRRVLNLWGRSEDMRSKRYVHSARIVLALLALQPEARAEDVTGLSSTVVAGSKVRVAAPSAFKGRITVPRDAVTDLEVSFGKRRRALKGMLIGAGIGAFLFPYGDCYDQSTGTTMSGCHPWTAQNVLKGAGLGALWGAGIGALVKSDRWSSVPLGRVRVSVLPARGGGIGASVSVGF